MIYILYCVRYLEKMGSLRSLSKFSMSPSWQFGIKTKQILLLLRFVLLGRTYCFDSLVFLSLIPSL